MASRSQGFSLSNGAFIGSYRVIEPIGRNALGEKYLVRSSRTRRNSALTVVDSGVAQTDNLMANLQALASMESPAIARVDMPEEDRGLVLIPAEFVEGIGDKQVTLADELAKKGGPLAEEVAEPLVRLLVSSLAYAHDFQGVGVCHGALSPQTISVSPRWLGRIRSPVTCRRWVEWLPPPRVARAVGRESWKAAAMPVRRRASPKQATF
jgi:serine/threonine protein kinase